MLLLGWVRRPVCGAAGMPPGGLALRDEQLGNVAFVPPKDIKYKIKYILSLVDWTWLAGMPSSVPSTPSTESCNDEALCCT